MYSQETNKPYIFVNIKDGTTQRAVSSIIQDQEGFIWMGTNGAGLNKYNGLDYISYKKELNNPKSLNSSLIHSSYVDSNNRLWIGTEVGLNLYDRELNQFIDINLYQQPPKKENIKVHSIFEDTNGDLLIGTHEHGLFVIDPVSLKSKRIVVESPLEISYLLINTIVKTKDETVLVGTDQGLFEYSNSKNHLSLHNIATLQGVKKINKNIVSMMVDANSALWIGTHSEGLIRVTGSEDGNYSINTYPITNKRILCMLQIPDGNIFCGTENDGLFVMGQNGKIIKNYRHNKFDKNSIKSNSIWSLFLDEQERIWMGYYNKGVGVYDEYYDKFPDIESVPNMPNSLESGAVTGIQKDTKGRLWISMDGGGVDIYDPIQKTFVHLADPGNHIASGLDNIDIQTIFIDSRENVWVGSWGSGIYYLEKNSTSFINYNVENTNNLISNRILSFAEDPDGIIWIGSFSSGLHSYNPHTKKFTHYDSEPFDTNNINYSDIRQVFIDSYNDIWICSNLGVYKINRIDNENLEVESMTKKMFGNEDTRDSHLFLSIYEDTQKNLWIGTDGNGLCKYTRNNETFIWYNKANGFDKETVSTIIESNNKRLWIGGNEGLSEFNLETGIITNFTVNDGLLSNDFNYGAVYKDEKGTLYFGSYEGVNYFNPEEILVNQNKPKVYLSDFKLFNESVEPKAKGSPLEKVISETKNITLTHEQSVFTIDFVCINHTRSEKNQYAYYLEGFENSWNYIGTNRSATYTNLPPGDYVFKVKASNNDGLWNETPTTLNLKILPPWWLSRSAILLYALIGILFSFLIFIFINYRLKEKRLIKYERDKRIQEEALNEKKIQFFTNISHEFRTPLTLILNPLEDIILNKKLSLSENVKEKLRIIHKNTNRLTRLIDELMDFRRLQFNKIAVNASEIAIVNLVEEVAGHFEEEALQKNIMLSVEYDDSSMRIWGDLSMLEKIIFNILSNAFKVTPENGVVTVNICRGNSPVFFPLIDKKEPFPGVEISIEDTGIGIKKEETEKIFERFYQAKEMDKQYYGGTGIGLEVVKSFIDLHKGKITVESKEGTGTKFRVFLPLGNEHFKTSELFLSKNEITSQARKNKLMHLPFENKDSVPVFIKNRKTLLVVEDNIELRTYLKNELENEYTIIEASNGKEGLELAHKRIPDIIMTDIIMPEMNGYEFCTLIKQDLKTSHIPLLMLTAKAMNDDWVRGIDSGADVYLHKPFDMKVLRSQLNQLISSRQILFNKYFNDISNTNLSGNTTSLDKEFIINVLRYIHDNISNADLNVENLADELFLSRSQLYRKIKALTGQTANEFLRKVRLEKAKQTIEAGNSSISEVSYNVGFSSPSYFSKCFKSHFGVLPTELNKTDKNNV